MRLELFYDIIFVCVISNYKHYYLNKKTITLCFIGRNLGRNCQLSSNLILALVWGVWGEHVNALKM